MKTFYIILRFSDKNLITKDLEDPIYLSSLDCPSMVSSYLFIWSGCLEDSEEIEGSFEDIHDARYISLDELLELKGLKIIQ
jgi:hypothetical protein